MSYVINDSKLVYACYKKNYKMIDYISNCLSILTNLVVYKLTNRKPVFLEFKNNTILSSFDEKKSESICLDKLFEYSFKVNRTLFKSYFK